jgi:hypothetical protein
MLDNKQKITEVIKNIIGNRIIKDNTCHCKMCKNTVTYKNTLIEEYQLLGFKLLGLDNVVHGYDFNYYENYSYDIKNLQKDILCALQKECYDVEHLILQPGNEKNYWSLSFTIKLINYNKSEIKHKQHSKCIKHLK